MSSKPPEFYFNKTLTAKIGNTIEVEPTIVISEQNKVKLKTQKSIKLYLHRWVHSGMTMTGALWPRTWVLNFLKMVNSLL